VGHSLGSLFILHLINLYKIKLDCAIFVSPFLDRSDNDPWQFDKVNSSFYKTDFDYDKLLKYIPISYVLYSDTDPYLPTHKPLHFARVLQSSHILIRKAGHFNADVSLYEFPLVYDLCISRLDLSLYQKYAYKKSVFDSIKDLTFSENRFMRLSKEEVADEGTFHSMNLSIGGFATYLSNTTDWDPEAIYFRNGRQIVKQGMQITRVFVIMDNKDLSREILRKQIKLDIQGGIDCYLISLKQIQKIKSELDFGIWDDEYICTIHRNLIGEVEEMIIDARSKSLEEARKWKKKILDKAIQIKEFRNLNEIAQSLT
jgi:hypothetical protein